MIDVNEMTFGIEIETVLPAEVVIQVGHYHQGVQVPELPAGWNAQRDCSIDAGGRGGGQPVEIVSPILKGTDGLDQIVFVLNWLREKNARVNKSTGLHVHVGFRGDKQQMAAVVSCVAQHEKALFASTGTKSREQGHYCRSIQADAQYQEHFRDHSRRRTGTARFDRYRLLNLTNVLGGGKPTIEFRVFAGTLSTVKVLSYVRLCLALVERALASGRKTKWEAKPASEKNSVHRKGGAGQTAMARLFYAIGWTKGRVKTAYGNVASAAAPASSIDEGKKELMRLARKYDGRAMTEELQRANEGWGVVDLSRDE
jgi:hypothetical protein